MGSDSSLEPSKKRKRSGSLDESPERGRTSSLIRRSIALLTAIPEVPATSLHPLLNVLTNAYGAALSAEASSPDAGSVATEDWNWELSAEQISRLSEEELTIWKDILVCAPDLRLAKIKLHPLNWKMPVVDLRQWEAHIPGNAGTPWEGGVYTLSIIFQCGFPERIPKMRFLRPLFHPNVYISGAYGYFYGGLIEPGPIRSSYYVWTITKQEDPERFAKLLRDVQKIIHHPDLANPHQADGYTLAKDDPAGYEKRIRLQAAAWTPDPKTGLAGRPILQPIKQEE
ncbi:ubiquitin-conjugating enzyme/RWD-like protein [Mycena filopes]|nr:ubiquitin-conjugating enzyme/RWD-like protein [Mycena filopes]